MISRFGRFAAWTALCLTLTLFLSMIPGAIASDTQDDILAFGCNYPRTLAEGKTFALKGVVISESSKIVRLVAGVFNDNGKMVTGRSWNPNTKSVDFRWYVNPYVKFGTLEAGIYTYKITATNGSVQRTLLNQPFEVTPRKPVPDNLKATGCNYPTSLDEGKGFAVRGVVSSQTSKITKLSVGAYDENNRMLTGRSWNPNAKSVDLRWYVNPYVKFGTLDAGFYTYKITATNAAGKETLLIREFEVTAPDPVSDKLSASGCNYPSSFVEGKGFAVRGVVSSQTSKITKLSVGAYDENNKMLTGRSWNPNAKSVDLRWYVNPYVKFGTLDAGFYTYKITATNAAGQETLLIKEFEVTAADPVSDKLSASGCNYPSSLVEGKGFALRGVVSSQTSKITKLSAGVYNENNKMLTGRSWNPNAKSVDLRWYVNPHVKFGTLDAGFYTYKITATNAAGQETLLIKEFEVTPAAPASDKLSSSGLNAPKLLIKGRGFALRGVVSSQTSNIKQLKAGVFDSDGRMLTGRSWNPKSKSVDFRWYVNPYVKFGTLDVGFYTYKVTATNDAGTKTLLEKEFEVVK